MCIVIVCWTGCDVINFQINSIFLIKLLFLHDQKVKVKFKYLEKKISFQDEIKSIFHHFKEAFIETNKTNYFGR